jgi:hypothetical protein
MRLERFAPPVPKQRLAEYMSKYARGRAALAGVGFREEARFTTQGELSPRADNENLKYEISHLKQNLRPGSGREEVRAGTGLKDGLEAAQAQDLDWNLNRNGERGKSSADSREARPRTQDANQQQRISKTDSYRFKSNSTAWDSISAKELAVQRELRVGQGPVCGPANVRPEVLERIRLREAAQARSKSP